VPHILSVTYLNSYVGGVYQQTTSGVTETDPNCYQLGDTACFSVYGFEYKPGFDNAVRSTSRLPYEPLIDSPPPVYWVDLTGSIGLGLAW
jgi:hypothetical protein